MAVNIPASGGDDEDVMATINTTPLVDVMLVMLIIFLITIPVVISVIPVELPKEMDRPSQTKPIDISLAVDASGQIYWGVEPIDAATLSERLRAAAVQVPQPELHIRADRATRFQYVGRIIYIAQLNQIFKMSFIIEPPPRS